MKNDKTANDPVDVGIKFAGETFFPGASNLLQGDLRQGTLHAVAGIFARSWFGLPGALVVSANSFAKALTGQHLFEHLELPRLLSGREESGDEGSGGKKKG